VLAAGGAYYGHILEAVRNAVVSSPPRGTRSSSRMFGRQCRHTARPTKRGSSSVSGCRGLPISFVHAASVDTLPAIHSDPLDRILIAQASTKPLRLLTHEEVISRYSDVVVLV
jgi:hypothetical protein